MTRAEKKAAKALVTALAGGDASAPSPSRAAGARPPSRARRRATQGMHPAVAAVVVYLDQTQE